MTHSGLLDARREALLAAVRPLVAGTPAVALLDFPAHGNVGDSAIWLGALATLRALGAPTPCYSCDADNYDRRMLARRLGAGTLLFTGGGSFGDLWERHLRFRERVIADFPGHRIVQLPESVHFQHDASLARAAATFNAHPDVTILVRDAASLDLVRAHFRASSALVPDLAMALGPLPRIGAPTRDILWLKRSDQEDRWPGASAAGEGDVADWIADSPSWRIAWTNRLRREAQVRPRLRPLAGALLQAAHSSLAAERLARGVALLSSTRVLVTDRLHGHILAVLLGIPHVVLDNTYGKLHRFVTAWTVASPLVRVAGSPGEATAHARDLLSTIDA